MAKGLQNASPKFSRMTRKLFEPQIGRNISWHSSMTLWTKV
jgi:hypothetical protein